MKDVNGISRTVKEDGRIWMVQGTLNIRKVLHTDAAKYQCIVRNSIGEKRIETALIVTGKQTLKLQTAIFVALAIAKKTNLIMAQI